MPTVKDALAIIHKIFPPSLADEGDPIGLQVGDPTAKLRGIALALEATMRTVEAAASAGANLLLTHHPLLFRPLRNITAQDPVGAVVHAAISSGLSIAAAHTNADWAFGGLNDRLAGQMGLRDVVPLTRREVAPHYKVVTFVPPEALEKVAEAMFEKGAGVIGHYRKCSYRLEGTGTFLPGDLAKPYSGTAGELSKEREIRFEALVPANALDGIISAMIAAHPYEEVAYDVYPLKTQASKHGVARMGVLPESTTPRDLGKLLKKILRLSDVRGIGPLDNPLERVAVCCGSGAGLIPEIAEMPKTVFVTGDVGYHNARLAEQLGLPVLDIGHFGGEIGFAEMAAQSLKTELEKASIAAPVTLLDIEKEPYHHL
jgi:dinuclear metal center YbgI/SA1388 family protein